jgi:hypothetical protein
MKSDLPEHMSPERFRQCMTAAGLGCADVARALRLSSANGFDTVQRMLTGKAPISGPVSVAMEALAAGFRPADRLAA